MNEVSRKIIKGEVAKGTPNYKVEYHCENVKCGKKGQRKAFLDDGLMFIPLPDGK
ncbi:MAG TPA: hypothetical protein VHE12_05475 [bacterium]|nr:hypothetical protein [bacterium]